MHVYEYVGMRKFGSVTQRLLETCRRLRWRVLPIGTRFGIRHCCGYYIYWTVIMQFYISFFFLLLLEEMKITFNNQELQYVWKTDFLNNFAKNSQNYYRKMHGIFKVGLQNTACITSMSVFFTNLVNGLVINRSSHLRYSVKKVFLEISQNSQTNQLCLSLFFNKVAGLRPATLLKKRHGHRCFPVNFVKFIRTPFYIEHVWWLLLH